MHGIVICDGWIGRSVMHARIYDLVFETELSSDLLHPSIWSGSSSSCRAGQGRGRTCADALNGLIWHETQVRCTSWPLIGEEGLVYVDFDLSPAASRPSSSLPYAMHAYGPSRRVWRALTFSPLISWKNGQQLYCMHFFFWKQTNKQTKRF